MSTEYLWRYLSLDKYEKLLEARSIYFPQASRLSDPNEGQWVAYIVMNRDDENRIKPLPNYISIVNQLLSKAGSDGQIIKQKCVLLLGRLEEDQHLLSSVLSQAVFAPSEKIEAYLISMIEGWTKAIAVQKIRKERWIGQNSVHRDSTYISCWCESRKLSMQMWDSFCGNKNGVAIKVKKGQLKKLIDGNENTVHSFGMKSAVQKVMYLDNPKKPSDETLDLVFDLMKKIHNSGIVQFLVKSNIHSDENEVRAILFPDRGAREPVLDPHPEIDGLNLEIYPELSKQEAILHFIDEVCVHPLLSEEDHMTQKIRELHRTHELCDLPLEVTNEVAFGD